jgi:hypothetical protein
MSVLNQLNVQALIELDGVAYNIGGFLANTTRGYLNRTDLKLNTVPDVGSFQAWRGRVLFKCLSTFRGRFLTTRVCP